MRWKCFRYRSEPVSLASELEPDNGELQSFGERGRDLENLGWDGSGLGLERLPAIHDASGKFRAKRGNNNQAGAFVELINADGLTSTVYSLERRFHQRWERDCTFSAQRSIARFTLSWRESTSSAISRLLIVLAAAHSERRALLTDLHGEFELPKFGDP